MEEQYEWDQANARSLINPDIELIIDGDTGMLYTPRAPYYEPTLPLEEAWEIPPVWRGPLAPEHYDYGEPLAPAAPHYEPTLPLEEAWGIPPVWSGPLAPEHYDYGGAAAAPGKDPFSVEELEGALDWYEDSPAGKFVEGKEADPGSWYDPLIPWSGKFPGGSADLYPGDLSEDWEKFKGATAPLTDLMPMVVVMVVMSLVTK